MLAAGRGLTLDPSMNDTMEEDETESLRVRVIALNRQLREKESRYSALFCAQDADEDPMTKGQKSLISNEIDGLKRALQEAIVRMQIEIERGTRAFRRCDIGISDQGSSSVILQGYIKRLACAYS